MTSCIMTFFPSIMTTMAFIGIFHLCEGPAVSLSFIPKSKSGTNVSSVFALKNGSWVAINNSPHVSKGANTQKVKSRKDHIKDDLLKSSLTSDVEDLFRKINRSIPLKILPLSISESTGLVTKSVSIARVASTEKSLGDLFLEWLNHQEEAKPSTQMASSSLPILGLQIDFDGGRNVERPTTSREVKNPARHSFSPPSVPRLKVSFRESPLSAETIQKTKESVRPKRSDANSMHQQHYYAKGQSAEASGGSILNAMNQSNEGGKTQEFHTGQLMVHNEMTNDKKHKGNDLPKYVMKFLSQCKALIEQNYDDEVEQGTKENHVDGDDAKSLINVGRRHIFKNKHKHTNTEIVTDQATVPPATYPSQVDAIKGNDEFESLTFINERPKIKIAKLRKNTNSSAIANNNRHQEYEDDLYEEAFEDPLVFKAGGRINKQSDEPPSKITKQAYFSSETNMSTCRPILEQFTPEKEIFTADCSPPIMEFPSMSPMQWKALMDFLNERVPPPPCSTSCSSACTRPSCTPGCTKPSCTPGCTKPCCTAGCTKPSCSSCSSPCKSNCSSGCFSCSKQCSTCTTPCSSCSTPCPCSTPCGCSTCNSCTGRELPFGVLQDEPENLDIDPEKASAAKTGKPPQRYLVKIETTKPKRFRDGLVQGRKPSNWFENIRNLRLLEGLKSPPPNTFKPVYMHPLPNEQQSITPAVIEDNTEKMIAEGVIPLKSGSTLNLYISYVLNKTKSGRNKLLDQERRRHVTKPSESVMLRQQ